MITKRKGHLSDLTVKFMPKASFYHAGVFSSERDDRLSSSCAHGSHGSSFSNGCSADKSVSFVKHLLMLISDFSIRIEAKHQIFFMLVQVSPALRLTVNYSLRPKRCQDFPCAFFALHCG